MGARIMYKLGTRSKKRLQGLHPDLVGVVERAIELSGTDFTVLEGVRTKERQMDLFDLGASKTMNSRHLTGHAVDLGALHNGLITWDWEYYYVIAAAMKQAAKEQSVDLEWGGDWKTFRDGPHFQLSWAKYPKEA
jgi:peptidoglycan L-alanyl-D-glutamate endopeptidase CwlK